MTRPLIIAAALLGGAAATAGPDDGVLQIRELADNVYLHTSYVRFPSGNYVPSNGLVVLNGQDAYLIDSPWPTADTPVLMDWAKQRGYHVRSAVATHFHDDRASGFAYLNEAGIDTVASRMTNAFLRDAGKPTAAREFTDRLPLVPGIVELVYAGPGHSRDNVVVWLPQQRMLFGGCLIKSMHSQTLGNVEDADIDRWQATLDTLTTTYPSISTVIPGHGEPGGPELIEHTGALVKAALQP